GKLLKAHVSNGQVVVYGCHVCGHSEKLTTTLFEQVRDKERVVWLRYCDLVSNHHKGVRVIFGKCAHQLFDARRIVRVVVNDLHVEDEWITRLAYRRNELLPCGRV